MSHEFFMEMEFEEPEWYHFNATSYCYRLQHYQQVKEYDRCLLDDPGKQLKE
jgi:hypothetical protein